MAGCHHPLCFTYNRALRHFKMCIACVCRGSALGRHSLKSANKGTCFEDPDVLNTPADAAFGMVYTCIPACSSPSVSRWKSGVVPSVSKRNCLPNMLSIANSCRARSPLFYDGKCRRTFFCFLRKLRFQDRFAFQNPMVRRPFQSKTEGPDALQLSRPSQRRDLANPGDFETLSL